MLTGKRFKLMRATLALGHSDGKHRAVTIPVGEILKILSEPNAKGMINVSWDGQILEMFAVDVEVRATETTD